MKASVFLYPWDVIGDPDAPARIAGLGAGQVTLAAAYHATRALTPHHPRHRVVTAEHAAVLYPVDERRWSGRALRPYPAGRWAPGDAYGEAAEALAAAGLDVHSWVVLAHNSRLGAEHPGTSVVNAYGDRYPWAPCIARPEVRAYLVALAAEAAVRPGARGTELESCGWYGLAHLHAHDKTAGVPLDDTAQYLMSLCFCDVCRRGYGEAGLDAERLAARVRGALEPVWAQGPCADGKELLDATVGYRASVARAFQEDVVRAVRDAAEPGLQVLLHADPGVHRCGANAGVDAAGVLGFADGVVVPCAGGRVDLLRPFAEHAPEGAVVAANFTVVAGMGGRPGTLGEDAARAAAAGATDVRLYHGGLASAQDLAAVRRSGAVG